jgi:RimJ/RimL family protein N-acetyltransferase
MSGRGRRHEPFGPIPVRSIHPRAFDPIGPSGGAVRPVPCGLGRPYRRIMTTSSTRALTALLGTERLPLPRTTGRSRSATTSIQIRPIRAEDHDELRRFYAGLSEESRRTRFFATTAGIGDRQSTYFCTPDHAHREGFVAVTGLSGQADRSDRIVGHVCLEPDGPDRAEIAIAVADAVQGRGVGRRLVEVAVDWARRDGIRTLTATMLAGNPAIQRLLLHLGLPTTSRPVGAGVVQLKIELDAVRSAA